MGLIGGCCLAFLAIFVPPFPVLARTGCSHHLLFVCIFTILGWIPGIFYAWYIILRFPDGKHRRPKREREVVVVERRSSHSNYASDHGRHHSGHHHSHGGYNAAPPAAQGLYHPPQETGYTSGRY